MLVAAATLAEVGGDFSNIICNIICVIWYLIAGFAALIIVLSGVQYIATEDPSKRNESRINIIYAIVGLIIVILAPYAANYLTTGLGILPFSCGCIPTVIPVTTTTTTTLPGVTTTSSTLPGVTTTSTTTTTLPGEATTSSSTLPGVSTTTTTTTTTTLHPMECHDECMDEYYVHGECRSSCTPSSEWEEITGGTEGRYGCYPKKCCCRLIPEATTSSSTTTSSTIPAVCFLSSNPFCRDDPKAFCTKWTDPADCYFIDFTCDAGFRENCCCAAGWGICC